MLDPIVHISFFTVLFWGIIAVSGIFIGTLMGLYLPLSHNNISRFTALAGGLLISAATIELGSEAFENITTPYLGFLALVIGALLFSTINSFLTKKGAQNRKRCGECVMQESETTKPGSGNAILIGTMIDAIPESLLLGITLFAHGSALTLVTAIAIGNLPEALSASAGMKAAGRPTGWIFKLWLMVILMSLILTFGGFYFATSLSTMTIAFLQLFGAGALISMVTETIIPEAIEGSPLFAGLITAIGFGVLFLF